MAPIPQSWCPAPPAERSSRRLTTALPPSSGLAVPSRRAKARDTITLYGIGFGPLVPDVPTGNTATQANSLQASVAVWFDGHPGRVTYAGSAPGFVGLYQFNVVVPDGVVAAGAFDDSVSLIVVLSENGNAFWTLQGTQLLLTALQG